MGETPGYLDLGVAHSEVTGARADTANEQLEKASQNANDTLGTRVWGLGLFIWLFFGAMALALDPTNKIFVAGTILLAALLLSLAWYRSAKLQKIRRIQLQSHRNKVRADEK